MTVTKIYTNETEFLLEDGFEKNMPSELTYLLTSGILCNNSGLINGDPTESCLLTIAGKWGVKFEETRKKFPRLDEMIFDSERKRMSTKNKIGNEFFLITKGAPDSILDICDKISINGKEIKLDPAERKKY